MGLRLLCVLSVCSGIAAGGVPAWAAERAEVERRMRDHLQAVSEGASVEGLRIEMIDGGMAAFRAFEIGEGKIVKREWHSPGSPEQREERAVEDEAVRGLIRELLAKEYWKFQGTRFVPDANRFIFRFWSPGLEPVDYWCDASEFFTSPERAAIRRVLLDFVAPGTG